MLRLDIEYENIEWLLNSYAMQQQQQLLTKQQAYVVHIRASACVCVCGIVCVRALLPYDSVSMARVNEKSQFDTHTCLNVKCGNCRANDRP